MFEEPFARGDSFIHRLDPRIRLSGALLSSVCVAVSIHLESALLGLALGLILLLLSQPAWKVLFKRILVVNVFILFLWLTVPLSMPGETIFNWSFLKISREGLELTLLVSLKSNAIVLIFIALVATLGSTSTGQALEQLRCPAKLVFLFLFTYRYLHVVAAEWQKLQTAARLRGFAPGFNLHTYRTMGNMLGMVFLRAFDRSGRIYEAMLLRGFSGSFKNINSFRTAKKDVFFMFAIFLSSAGIILSDLQIL